MTSENSGLSRRTLAKGAAWAAPAVVVAAAAPMVSASVITCVTAFLSASACKWSGANNSWSYKLDLCFTNDCPAPETLEITRIMSNSGVALVPCGNTEFPIDVTVPANTTAADPYCVELGVFYSSNSANWLIPYYEQAGVEYKLPTLDKNGIPSPPSDCPGTSPCATVAVAEEPPAEQSVAQEPPAEEPPAEQSVAQEPPAEEPPAEDPPVEQSVAEQPAEQAATTETEA